MRLRLQFRRYRLPFRSPVRTAHGPWVAREGVVLRLEDEAGRVGWGEAAPIPAFGTETAQEAEDACRALGEWTSGAALDAVPGRLGCLRAALAGARGECSGGETINPERRYVPVAALLPAGKPALAMIPDRLEAGFRVFKWKVGVGDPADELSLLDDVCAALPSGAKLRLDANGAWERRHAERWLERCAERPIEFVEQPCAAAGPGADQAGARRREEDLLLGLAGDFPTPLALDESLVGDGDVARWLDVGWPGVFVVKPSLLGDLAAARTRLVAARAPVVFSSALETAVGARAALRAAWSWPGELRAVGFGVWPLFADPRCDGPRSAPFLRGEDVAALNPEETWNALA
jgi:O-succinylbenzoate synthase